MRLRRGLLKALSALDCSVKCCYFHQTQAIWRFAAKKGLSGQYVSNETFRWNVRALMVLPLFPEDKIRKIFHELRNQLGPDDVDSRAVYNSFEDVWFTSFPIPLWCQNKSLCRTNNVVESFHAALARRILHHHPQFNTFSRQLVQIIHESKKRLEEDRLHPKERPGTKRRAGRSGSSSRTTQEALHLRFPSGLSWGPFRQPPRKGAARGRV